MTFFPLKSYIYTYFHYTRLCKLFQALLVVFSSFMEKIVKEKKKYNLNFNNNETNYGFLYLQM